MIPTRLLTIGPQLAEDPELMRLAQRGEVQLEHASGRTDGLAAVRARHPDVVLVAHDLGDDDGVDVLKAVKSAARTSEAVLVTARGDVDAAIEVLRAGALDYLSHPIDRQQLALALGRAAERRLRGTAPRPATILVVDDDEITLRHVANVLRKEGYEVLVACDGAQAIRTFHETKVDIIFSDLVMPGADGYEVLQATRGADVEVIVVTGHGNETAVVRALREGAINFLKKPVEVEHMLLAIEKALEHQTLRRSLAYRDRDMQLMQELVIRLTNDRELVVEAPFELSATTLRFVQELVGGLPFGLLLLASDRRVAFANKHLLEKTAQIPERATAAWLLPLGLPQLTDEQLVEAFERALDSPPGHIETLVVSRWAFLLMTPLRLQKPGATERYVAIAIRGERTPREHDT